MSPRVPDVAGVIEAYRIFSVEGDKLASTGARYVWKAGMNSAKCDKKKHVAPVAGCSCGFWSFIDADTAYKEFIDTHGPAISQPVALGRISVWGKVIEGEIGFRSQRAEIVELFPLTCKTDTLHKIADAYGASLSTPYRPMGLPPVAARTLASPPAPPATPKPAPKPAPTSPVPRMASHTTTKKGSSRELVAAWLWSAGLVASILLLVPAPTHHVPSGHQRAATIQPSATHASIAQRRARARIPSCGKRNALVSMNGHVYEVKPHSTTAHPNGFSLVRCVRRG